MNKAKDKKNLHEELEIHHKHMEKIAEDASKLLGNYRKKTGGTGTALDIKIKKELIEEKVKRIKTGVQGFDYLVEGGVPEKSLVLLTGTTGTGKSIFGMEFLLEGAFTNEPGVYICLQESMDETINQMRFFGWPVRELIKKNKILIIQPELYNFDALLTAIEDSIEKVNAKRLVIDSVSIIGMYFEEPFKIRKSLLDLGKTIRRFNCTTLAISEVGEGKIELSPYGIEEYVADGVIVLYYMKRGSNFVRAVCIRKMRSTKHSTKIHPMEIIRPGGIIVYPSEEVFTLD